MTCLNNFLLFLRTWGAVIGLVFDIAGACFVYMGVRTTLVEALHIEASVLPEDLYAVGSREIGQRAEEGSLRRAQERLRAKRWSRFGLVFFVLGFVLQAVGGWPKQ